MKRNFAERSAAGLMTVALLAGGCTTEAQPNSQSPTAQTPYESETPPTATPNHQPAMTVTVIERPGTSPEMADRQRQIGDIAVQAALADSFPFSIDGEDYQVRLRTSVEPEARTQYVYIVNPTRETTGDVLAQAGFPEYADEQDDLTISHTGETFGGMVALVDTSTSAIRQTGVEVVDGSSMAIARCYGLDLVSNPQLMMDNGDEETYRTVKTTICNSLGIATQVAIKDGSYSDYSEQARMTISDTNEDDSYTVTDMPLLSRGQYSALRSGVNPGSIGITA